MHFSAVSCVGNTLLAENYLIRATLPRENSEKMRLFTVDAMPVCLPKRSHNPFLVPVFSLDNQLFLIVVAKGVGEGKKINICPFLANS